MNVCKRQSDKEGMEEEEKFSITGSLPRWLQQLGLDQAKPEPHSGLSCKWQGLKDSCHHPLPVQTH